MEEQNKKPIEGILSKRRKKKNICLVATTKEVNQKIAYKNRLHLKELNEVKKENEYIKYTFLGKEYSISKNEIKKLNAFKKAGLI